MKDAWKHILAVMALTAMFAAPALADDLMDVVHEGDIAYMTGGIGLEEREVMKASAKDFNLFVTNAVKDNHLTSDVMLLIKDKKGATLLTVKETGPLFYARFPAGSYVVEAHNGDQHHKRHVKIGKNTKAKLHFMWGNGLAAKCMPSEAVKAKEEVKEGGKESAPAAEEDKKESGEAEKAKPKKSFFDFSPIMKDSKKDKEEKKEVESRETVKEGKNGKNSGGNAKKDKNGKEPEGAKKENKNGKESSGNSDEDSPGEKRQPRKDNNHEEPKGL